MKVKGLRCFESSLKCSCENKKTYNTGKSLIVYQQLLMVI